jgi:hypothetical protein
VSSAASKLPDPADLIDGYELCPKNIGVKAIFRSARTETILKLRQFNHQASGVSILMRFRQQ